eukprot:scaffold19255_cov30-Tisochrysis_lutea.AAC.3
MLPDIRDGMHCFSSPRRRAIRSPSPRISLSMPIHATSTPFHGLSGHIQNWAGGCVCIIAVLTHAQVSLPSSPPYDDTPALILSLRAREVTACFPLY